MSVKAVFALVFAVSLVSGCGGGADSPASVEGRATALAVPVKAIQPATAAIALSVVSVTKVSETRVGRTLFDYVFRISVKNDGEDQVAAEAILGAVGQGTSIVDGRVELGAIATGVTAEPIGDTITLRHDRAYPFDMGALVWAFRTIPAVQPMTPGASIFSEIVGEAAVEQPFEARLRIVPNDERNVVLTLVASTGTAGGTVPSVTVDGLLTWTPNAADFATQAIQVVASMQDGSTSTFDLPVTVTRRRQVATLSVDGSGRYSDPFARYVLEVSPAVPGDPVVGEIKIFERYDIKGAYRGQIEPSDPSILVDVVVAPDGSPPAVGPLRSRLKRQPVKANQAMLASSGMSFDPVFCIDDENPSLPYCSNAEGQEINSGLNSVYTTRRDVFTAGLPSEQFPSALIAKIQSNCADPKNPRTSQDGLRSCDELVGTPVIMIHGFTLTGIGGGVGTWGSLAAELSKTERSHPVFELRYSSRVRFEEVSGLLVQLARHVSSATGRKPFVIAHSFGGVVSHLALAGKGLTWNPSEQTWESIGLGTKEVPVLDGLVTLGSPLSGINDDEKQSSFAVGRYDLDVMINICESIECAQAGAFDVPTTDFTKSVGLFDPKGAAPLEVGGAIEAIRQAWSGTNRIALDSRNIHTVVSLRERPFDDFTPDLRPGTWYKLGDGLISLAGQAVVAYDFLCSDVFGPVDAYDLRGCINRSSPFDVFSAIDIGPPEGSVSPFVYVNVEGRNYYFSSRAAHTNFEFLSGRRGLDRYETKPYRIAHYEDRVRLGEYWNGIDFFGSHPLRYFLDNVLKRSDATPAEVYSAEAKISGSAVFAATGQPATGLPTRVLFLKVGDGAPVRVPMSITLDANGRFTFDAAAMLRTVIGPEVVLSDYRVRMEIGNGVDYYTSALVSSPLGTFAETEDLGTVRLQSVQGPAPLVQATGTVRFAEAPFDPVAGAQVRFARGVNLSAAEVFGMPQSNVSRQVVTDSDGAITAANLLEGEYTVVVSRSGFADRVYSRELIDGVRGLELQVGEPILSVGNLNDTGISADMCYGAGSNVLVNCASPEAVALNDKQDGMTGRDVSSNDDADGRAGFSYGLVAKPGGGFYGSTECVKDLVSGLVWEGKTTDGGPRDLARTYTNWGDERADDVSEYVNVANVARLCGYGDWRLPTATELQGLVDYSVPVPGPMIDLAWFSNTAAAAYWAAEAYAGDPESAWLVRFETPEVYWGKRSQRHRVRLVR